MSYRGFHIFDIAGFNIRVDASWLFIAALMVWGFYRNAFPDAAPGLPDGDYILMAVSVILAFFVGLVVHEAAHSLMARQFGLKVGGITLFVFGGVADLTDEPHDPKSEFWIALAGPAASLAIAAVCTATSRMMAAAETAVPARVVLDHLAMLNVTMAVFNLVPAYPLDGGRMLRAVLWHTFGNQFRATMIAAALGIFFAWVLVLTGITALFTAGDSMGLWLVLIGMFLLTLAHASRADTLLRTHLGGRMVASVMTPGPVTTKPEATLADVIDKIVLATGHAFLPVVAHGRLRGVIDATAIRTIDRDLWPTTTVAQIMEPLGPDNTVEPDTACEMVLHQMVRTGLRKLVVARQDHLVGVVTIADLMNYVGLVQLFNNGIVAPKSRPLRRKAGGGSHTPHSRLAIPRD
jgi:Zn-dependent protease/CBS domain-containing protein